MDRRLPRRARAELLQRSRVESRARREPASDGVVLAQVVEREADDRRVQHVVRVRVDLRPLRPLLLRVSLGALLSALEGILCPLLRLLVHARRCAGRDRMPCDATHREARCRGAHREQHGDGDAGRMHRNRDPQQVAGGNRGHVPKTVTFVIRYLLCTPPPPHIVISGSLASERCPRNLGEEGGV